MCNDYRLMVELASIIEEFEHLKIKIRFPEGRPNIEAREDIRITDTAPIVRSIEGERGAGELVQRRWSWPGPSKKPVYNFRSEGREFASNWALILSDGFYEFMWTLWRALTGGNDAIVRRREHNQYELVDETGVADPLVTSFATGLIGRGCSPHTVAAYLYDLRLFYRFLAETGLTLSSFRVAHSVELLAWLGAVPCPRARITSFPSAVRTTLSPTSINRAMAAISSFFDHLALADLAGVDRNPLATTQELARGGIARRRARGARRLKRVERIPRPMTREQVDRLLDVIDRPRDRAMILIMLQGGLRPGEVLNLHLDDIEYGRRRVTVRHRIDHPKGVRTKSRTERVVDVHEPEALAAISRYVLEERPRNAPTRHLFLVCGKGKHAYEALSYAALVKMFKRRCATAGLTEPWITPHALRHTHATWLWEGGMRELALQKRLGHVSFESTRTYTRVSDAVMLEEYRRALSRRCEEQADAEQE